MRCYISLILLVFIYATPLFAEPLCAAVYPCNESGELLPQYQTGECASYYQAQCGQIEQEIRAHELRSCGKSLAQTKRVNKRLRQKVRAFRKLLSFKGQRQR